MRRLQARPRRLCRLRYRARSRRRLSAFQGCGSPVRLGLTLRRGTDNNLAHVNIGGLLDREHDGSGDRVGRDPHFVHAIADLAFYFGLVMDSVKFVFTKPGEIIVTRNLSPASWRKPSEIARTANFVPA